MIRKHLKLVLILAAVVAAGMADGGCGNYSTTCVQTNKDWMYWPYTYKVDVYGQNCDWGHPYWGTYPDPGLRICNNYYLTPGRESGAPGQGSGKFKNYTYWFTDNCAIAESTSDPTHRIPR